MSFLTPPEVARPESSSVPINLSIYSLSIDLAFIDFVPAAPVARRSPVRFPNMNRAGMSALFFLTDFNVRRYGS